MFSKVFVLTCLVAFAAAIVEDPKLSGRIVGGSNVNLGQVPYMATLQSLTGNHFCGGSILNTRWILTSASCTAGRAANSINVRVGTITRGSGTNYRSANIIAHPLFDPITLANE